REPVELADAILRPGRWVADVVSAGTRVEVWIRDQHEIAGRGGALGLQNVSSAGDVGDGVALDEELPAAVDQGGERDEAEDAVGADENLLGIPECFLEGGPDFRMEILEVAAP